MRKLLLAVLMVALISMPAFASVQNIKISGSIDSTYLYRSQFDFGTTVDINDNTEWQNLFITQTLLRADADLTDKVSAVIALLNEREWGETSLSSDTEVILHLAYVTLREMLYSPLTIIVGRQDFGYGNCFILCSRGARSSGNMLQNIPDSGLNAIANDLGNTSKDAVRAILDYDPLTVELLFMVETHDTIAISVANDDIYVYGANASYELGDEMDSLVEAYLFIRKNKGTKYDYTAGKIDVMKVAGIRGSTKPIEGLNLQAEYAHQGGTYAAGNNNNRTRDAHGVQFIANYQLPILQDYVPVLSYEYTKVSGDNDASADENYTAWDSFYEDQGRGTIYNALFDLTNCVVHTLGLTATPMEDLTAKLMLTKLFTAADYRSSSITLYQEGSSTYDPSNIKPNKRALGLEIDFHLLWDYTEDVQLGLNFGIFKPLGLFEIDDDDAKQLLLTLGVDF